MTGRGATVLVVIASVLLVGATVAGYARLAVFNSNQFADRAAAALAQPAVRTAIGDRVTDEVILRNDADLIAARPLIASAVSGIVGGGAFRSLFRRAVLDAHRAIFTGDRDTLTLTLADVSTVVAAALEKVNPQLADDLDAGERVVLLKRDLGSVTGDVVRTGERLRVLAWVLAALTLAAAAAALIFSPDRRRTSAQLGVGVAAAGLTIVIAYTVARALLVEGASAAVWDAYLGDLRAFGWVLAGAGAVIAAAAASLIAPIEIERHLRAAWRIATTEPTTTWLRLARAATLVVAGILLIARPLAALQIAVTLLGVYLLYKGLEIVLRMVHRPREADAPATPARARPHRARRIAVPVLAALLIAVAVSAFAAGGGTEAPAQPVTACNGAAALCDRPLDEVVLPATHNSMSAPLPGWYSAEQETPDRPAARGRDPRPAVRHPLRRPARQRAHPHLLRQPRAARPRGDARRRQPGGGRVGAAPARPARLPRRGNARDVPLPQLLRARGDAARRRPRRHPPVPRHPPGRGRRDHQPGLRDAGGLRRRRSMTPGSRATPPPSASGRGRRCGR